MKQQLEIPTDLVRVGHYVSRLDRPWLGTPFLFQGFQVSSEEEVRQLRALCNTVEVSVSGEEADRLLAAGATLRSTVATGAFPALVVPMSGELLNELANDTSIRVVSTPTTDEISLETELLQARATLAQAHTTVGNMFESLRRGGGLDVPHLDSVMELMVDSVLRNREAMTWLTQMKSKDDYLYRHSLATSVWALAFGRHLGLDKDSLKILGTGAMLLDIGKTMLPTELLRAPRPLPAESVRRLRDHVRLGLEILHGLPDLDPRIATMVATHHERVDGGGYPGKLSGNAIPLLGRIARIVDSYDAMTQKRPYATPRSTSDAISELRRHAGTRYSAELVELFIQAVGVFPTGTTVELNTGEVGIVVAQNRFRRLRPAVMLILDAAKEPLADYRTIDLHTCQENIGAKPEIWIARGLETGCYGIDPGEYFL